MSALAEAGFEFAEVALSALADRAAQAGTRESGPELTAELHSEVVTGFPGFGLRVVGPDVPVDELKACVRRAFKAAAAAGARVLVLDDGAARSAPEGFPAARAWHQLRHFLGAAAKVARRHRLALAIQPLPRRETDLIHTVEEAWLLCHEVGHEGVGVAADVAHLHEEREPYDALIVADTALSLVRVPARGIDGDTAEEPDCGEAFGALRVMRYAGLVSVHPELADAAREAPRLLRRLRRVAGLPP
jgi:sugar phosphate isomerase/epimerase